MSEVELNPSLSALSLGFIYIAMAIYTVSFLVLVWHLFRAASLDKTTRAKATVLEKSGFGIMALATVIHGIGVVMRGIAAVRVPWANMYEFSISGSFLIAAIFLCSLAVKEIRIIAAFVNAFVLLVLGAAVTIFYVQLKTLMPALQSYWLWIHVTVAVLATAFLNIAASLSVAYLLRTAKWLQNSKSKTLGLSRRILELFPTQDKLDQLQKRFNGIGLVLWSFTLIAGAIWAEKAWHRYWGWDTKEVWTFIIWVLYAGYFHAVTTRGWTGRRAAWLSLVGYSAVLFNFTIVNLFFKGLHVYSGLK